MTQEPDLEELYSATMPSVVSVYRSADRLGGAGSGFVYDAEGHVVTNEHVVGDAEEVDVRFSEGDWRVGRVVGVDAYTDLAVVRIDDLPAGVGPLPIAAENPAPGTRVAAFGNPMGLDGSMSIGVVSGANRSMGAGNGFAIPDVVQTDAAINPGNSGGPLVTTAGEVVGINRAKSGDNIGFAVSADVARRVVPGLIENGGYRHSYLKIRTLDVSPSVARANGLEDPRGVLVVDVSLGPASAALVGCSTTRRVRGRDVPAGGDVITRIGDRPVNSHEELMRHLVLETDPGDEVTVELIRDGTTLTERLTLAERPAPEGSDRRQRRRRRRRGRRGRDGGTDIPVR